MAIDPHAHAAATPATPISAIENELPTYRAISPLAVGSVVLGLVGGLAFANLMFVAASVLAVLTGGLALWRIREQPEALTGRGFAQTGIVLGLVTGLSSVTIDFTQNFMMTRAAESYVRDEIVPILAARDLNGALWLKTHPDQRRGMTPEQVMEMYRQRNESDPMSFQMAAGKVLSLHKMLEDQPDAKIVFERIEHSNFDGLTPVAVGLLRIDGLKQQGEAHAEDDDHDHSLAVKVGPETPGREYVGVMIKAVGDAGNQSWWVEDYVYPYQPDTLKEKPKPIDDGHGHGPGG